MAYEITIRNSHIFISITKDLSDFSITQTFSSACSLLPPSLFAFRYGRGFLTISDRTDKLVGGEYTLKDEWTSDVKTFYHIIHFLRR